MILNNLIHDDGLVGQLGNKLFIISAMIGYSEKYGKDFGISDWQYRNDFPNLIPKIRDFHDSQIVNHQYQEPSFSYKEIPKFDTGLIQLLGYYQSEKYFSNYKDEVMYYLSPSKDISEQVKQSLSNISGETCSIHIRRGDYLNINTSLYHGNCSTEYYLNAIKYIKSLKNISKFVVYSDDINWCKTVFIGSEFYFMEGNRNVVDLFSMSVCRNNIIANSSFSWWASWLNQNSDKIIVAPKEWFGQTGPKDFETIYTRNMVRI